MATLALAALGSAAGTALGGSFLGVSAAALGRAAGATIGRAIDQRLLSGLSPIRREGPRLDNLSVMTSDEGAALAEIWGRAAVAGEVIWAANLKETASTESSRVGSGKSSQRVDTQVYSYSASFAVSLGEGPMAHIGRIWADGQLLDASGMMAEGRLRFYTGSETQDPDPLIVATEGAAPAYRGTAYVVFEDLPLGDFGNRVPQIKVEVWGRSGEMERLVKGVNLIPGSTEWGYMPEVVTREGYSSDGEVISQRADNAARHALKSDWAVSLDQMGAVLPEAETVSLVVAWFGTDLRAGLCEIEPRVEIAQKDTDVPWMAGGLTRAQANVVSTSEGGTPAYGSAPADVSVVEAIKDLRARGKRVVLYPFVMMDVTADQALPTPDGTGTQGAYPWRGRIEPRASEDATAEVAAFMGTAEASDFAVADEAVSYSGPSEWRFRRFILHLAHLAKAAGGVDAILIGTEMRGLSMAPASPGDYPFVSALRALAGEVRAVLPDAQIGYAADWSEYHSHRMGGEVYFHLDPLWADSNIDFVGIDNYLPLSDWRAGTSHADYDAAGGVVTPYNLDYLKANIEGGEYWDWYYADEAARNAQDRTPISDGATRLVHPPLAQSFTRGDEVPDSGYHILAFASERFNDVTFWSDVVLPATPVDGVIFERGGLSLGTILTIRDGGQVLRLRSGAGDQALSGSTLDTAVLDVPVADLPFDGATHVLTWEMRIGGDGVPGRVRLWCDGVLAGAAQTLGDALANGTWSGGGNGIWGDGGTAATNIAGEPTVPFGPIHTPLHMGVGLATETSEPTPWVFRQKAIRDWHGQAHHNRPGGVPSPLATDWVPGSKPVWFTELGCPAVDLGANQPNVFYAAQSSEGALPWFSGGVRDDFMQRQFLRASLEWWRDNGAGVVHIDNIQVWCWDARPFPEFPVQSGIWADGPDWVLGHWLNGRAGAAPAAEAIAARLTERHGLAAEDMDLSACYGQADGYPVTAPIGFRDFLQPLEVGLALQAHEAGGKLVVDSRPAALTVDEIHDSAMVDTESEARFTATRGALEDVASVAVLQFQDGLGDYTKASTRALIGAGLEEGTAQADTPLVLDFDRGTAAAERLLRAASDGREGITFRLPRSATHVRPGVILPVRLSGGDLRPMMVEKVTEGADKLVEARAFAHGGYAPTGGVFRPAPALPVQGATAVLPRFLDLPVLPGTTAEDWDSLVAFHADPWPGGVVWARSSDGTGGFTGETLAPLRATLGETTSDLAGFGPHRWQESDVTVRLYSGSLVGRPAVDVLAGANALALAHPEGWEVLQFRDAELIGTSEYRLSGLLRGRLGTDAVVAPEALASGAALVVLDDAVQPLGVSEAEVGVQRFYRSGPSGLTMASHGVRSHTGQAVARRPYAPCHLRVRHAGGDVTLSWVRRTREDGEADWRDEIEDVPLGEASEVYTVQVVKGGVVLRTLSTDTPGVTYTSAMAAEDGATAPFLLRVAQVSETYGPGGWTEITVT